MSRYSEEKEVRATRHVHGFQCDPCGRRILEDQDTSGWMAFAELDDGRVVHHFCPDCAKAAVAGVAR